MMSVKKPSPIQPTPKGRLCPVCGKTSYSRSGEHPQCSVNRADLAAKAAQKALAAAQVAADETSRKNKKPGTTAMNDSQHADQDITQKVNHKLANRGLRPPCRVAVATKGGEVTLSGSVQYGHQKRLAVSAASGIKGVRRVVDQLTVTPVAKRSQA
jgi:osmotically-inducible protein OsmY